MKKQRLVIDHYKTRVIKVNITSQGPTEPEWLKNMVNRGHSIHLSSEPNPLKFSENHRPHGVSSRKTKRQEAEGKGHHFSSNCRVSPSITGGPVEKMGSKGFARLWIAFRMSGDSKCSFVSIQICCSHLK